MALRVEVEQSRGLSQISATHQLRAKTTAELNT
jgi:hypothetical protein